MTPTADAPQPHPFLGDLPVTPPDQEAAAVAARAAQWESSLKPWDVVECSLVNEVARESIRLERLHQREIALRHARAAQAREHWDADRRGDARAHASRLSRHPALALAQLRRTLHGNELVACLWDTLAGALDARGAWTAPERLLALNLLDVLPALREAPSPLDAPAGADPRAHLRSVCDSESRRHRDSAAALAPVDAIEREAAALGLGPDTPELASLRKEERASSRRLAWCRSQFHGARQKHRIDPADAPYSTSRRFEGPPELTDRRPGPRHPSAPRPTPDFSNPAPPDLAPESLPDSPPDPRPRAAPRRA